MVMVRKWNIGFLDLRSEVVQIMIKFRRYVIIGVGCLSRVEIKFIQVIEEIIKLYVRLVIYINLKIIKCKGEME